MDLIIERGPAFAALSRITGVVERKGIIDILSHVALHAEGEQLTLRGTNLDMEVIVTMPAVVTEPGEMTVPADKLNDIVSKTEQGGQIALFTKDTDPRVTVKAGRSRFNLPSLPVQGFPRFPAEEFDGRFMMPAKTLVDMVSRVEFMADRGQHDSVLSCVYLGPHEDQLHVVSASSNGIALRREPKPEGADIKAILPMKLVGQITKWLAGVEGDVTISWVGWGSQRADKLIRLEHEQTIINAKLYDHPAFVPYMTALLEDQEVFARTDQDALAHAVSRVQVMQDVKSNAVRLKFGDGGVTVQARNDQAGEGEAEIAAEYVGPEYDFLLNSGKLTDLIGSLRGDVIEIGFCTQVVERDQNTAKVVARAPADTGFAGMLMQRRA